ncbi:MAG: 30S ribosomal protein S17 [Candidatus Micrarchaeota archaeon]|nr:30S ribosomal protein S17 [Candidatus Micrarchaeota archaeon]
MIAMSSLEELNKKLQERIKEEKILPRGISVRGKVVSTKAKNTVTIERTFIVRIPKYKRYMRKRSKIHAHVPDGISLRVGDEVIAQQTRKISKTKAWVVTKVVKRGEEA